VTNTDVFIIGGGPAGLAAALAARAEGFRVTVADWCRPPIDKACGEGLMPDSLEALAKLGVTLDLRECRPFRGIRFVGNGTSAQADFPSGVGIGVRRTILHRLLVESAAAAGVAMLWGARIQGLSPDGVRLETGEVRCRWVIGADGGRSFVRRWAGLEACSREQRRFGFRRHYRVEPWAEHMELYWGAACQIYVTPVACGEICVAVISKNRRLRLDEALVQFPELAARLHTAPFTTIERGAVSATRKLKSVCRGRVALIGDASGSVDAITGEGLSIAFRQAPALADALAADDLERYQSEHRRIARRPEFMSAMMLTMAERPGLRLRALRAFDAKPSIFSRVLAAHVGALSPLAVAAAGVSLGWQMLTI
jgi:menaquinone-9 beta-reductase